MMNDKVLGTNFGDIRGKFEYWKYGICQSSAQAL